MDAQIDPVHRPHAPHRALEDAPADGKVHFEPFEPDQLRRSRRRPDGRWRRVRLCTRRTLCRSSGRQAGGLRLLRRRRDRFPRPRPRGRSGGRRFPAVHRPAVLAGIPHLRTGVRRRRIGAMRSGLRRVAPAGGPGEVLGHRRQKLARVGVRRAPQHIIEGAGLHDPAFAHDRHPVGDLRDHPEVVGDEEQAHAAPALELLHQAQDPGLHRHVQGGGRLVRDQQAGAAGDGHGDHHPLALAAGEAVGVFVHAQLRVLDPHLRQRLDRLAAGLLVAEARAGEPDRLDDLVADGEHRVQRGHGLLEDHRDVPAAHLHPLLLGQPQQVARRGVGPRVEAEQDLAVATLGEVRGQQADHRQGGDGLAAARFAHQAEGLPRLDVEARPVHRPHRLPVGPEPSMEVPHFEQRPRVPGRAGWGHGPGLPGVRRLRAALGVVSP